MTQRWRDLTVGELIDGVKRYQPFLATVLVLLLIAVVLPGRGGDSAPDQVAAGLDSPAGGDDVPETTAPATEATQGVRARASDGAGRTQVTGAGGAAGTSGTGGGGFAGTGGSGGGELNGAHNSTCDPATGRIAIPSVYAPPCPPAWSGDNGGATSNGVSGDTIKIAVYLGELDPQTGTALTLAGAEDPDDDQWETYNDYADYFNSNYEMWGRKVELIRIDGGQPNDDVAAKANSEEVINAGAFASLGGPTDTNVYLQELAAAGIICICTQSQPIETYLDHAPYVWSNLMSSTQLYVHRAEFVGKRLAGRLAKHAGSPDLQLKERTFALVYFDTAAGTYTAGAKFFQQELKKYGIDLPDEHIIPVTGAHNDQAAAQNEAPHKAQKLKDLGITSVLFAGDPFYPIYLTKEAFEDQYEPEWIVTGSVLTDTTLFARLYNQEEWEHAFGLSALSARQSEDFSEAMRLHRWWYPEDEDGEPTADGTYALIYAPSWILWTGIHMAGPELTPFTFRDGLFAYPRSGNGPVHASSSFGNNLWRWDDYLRLDDTAELWYDRFATGENEVGLFGTGMYRYVEGGHRYLAGERPTTDPPVLSDDNGNSVMIYEDGPPEGDRWPEYDSPKAQG